MVSSNDVLNMDEPRISDFFKDKSIFITGGSGFMGKILVEKLLRSCSGMDKIYLLLRSKKGYKPEERLAEMYKSPLFERLKSEKPGLYESKVCAVTGDVIELGLGLSEADRALLVGKVTVIFHVAASVRFDDPLKFAVLLNLRGTREVLELAKEIKDLSVLVHVSTSYSNTNRNPVEEIIYPPHADWRETIRIAETIDEYTLRMLTPKYLGELPNTYTFTKQLAEHVIYEQYGKMPIVIFRPSIVISAVSEPMPGWIENFNGPVGMMVASGKGIMRSIYGEPQYMSDYMPVDFAIKAMIISAWKHGSQLATNTIDIPVYNCCSSKLKQVTMQRIVDIGQEINSTIPLNDGLWYPGGAITRLRSWHYIKVMFLHLLPAIIVDLLLKGIGRKPMLIKLQRRIYIANIALNYYVINQWSFNNERFYGLRKDIPAVDRKDFDFDIKNLDVFSYFKQCVLGGRRHLLNEPDDTIPKALVHQRRLYFIDLFTKAFFGGLLLYWALQFSSYFSDFLYMILPNL